MIKKVFAAGNVTPGFNIPSLPQILSYIIKLFFIIAGLAALLYLLMGAFEWITSGGDKDKVGKAQQKIQAAVIGLLILVLVLAIIATVEQFIFNGKICLGLTCDLKFEPLLQ